MIKKFQKKVLQLLAPPIIYVLNHLLYLTCKKNFHYNKEKKAPTPSVFVLWHGELLMLAFAYVAYRGSKNIDSIISEHGDGEIASRYIRLFGGGVIRGSSTRGGIKALKAAFNAINQKRDIGITPDGPRGPRYSISNGVVQIAQRKSVPIVCLNVRPSSCWRFDSWDKFFIPKPFATLDFYISEPFYIDGMDEEAAKKFIQERLLRNAF